MKTVTKINTVTAMPTVMPAIKGALFLLFDDGPWTSFVGVDKPVDDFSGKVADSVVNKTKVVV